MERMKSLYRRLEGNDKRISILVLGGWRRGSSVGEEKEERVRMRETSQKQFELRESGSVRTVKLRYDGESSATAVLCCSLNKASLHPASQYHPFTHKEEQ